MGGDGEVGNPPVLKIDRDFTDGLGCITEERNSVGLGNLSDILDRINRANSLPQSHSSAMM